MNSFHDFFINSKLKETAEEFGWTTESIQASVKKLEAKEWGELKKKIQRNRENYDILGFKGGNHELNRKAFSTPKIDVVLHPEKGRKDSGMNQIDAKQAAKNQVAIGFSLKQIPDKNKKQSQKLSKWRRNIKICKKYDTPYIITTEANKKNQLRRPRDLAAILKSLGNQSNKPVAEHPGKILEKNLETRGKKTSNAGHEVVE